MFGIIRPCRHRLSGTLHADWVAHLCGLCLTLRSEHGQTSRTATNYDGLVISVLVEAQSVGAAPRRRAGPCPLRGMRRASVVHGGGARLAATVSLVLASVKLRDHADDGDGAFRYAAIAGPARRTAARWVERGGTSGAHVGFDTALLTEAAGRQQEVERSLSPGDSVLVATEPTELATSAAFGHTAVLAERPVNAEPLAEVGRLFGRVAHLLDAVEDLAEDTASGAWNPLVATATDLDEARRLCDDAVHGVRPALRGPSSPTRSWCTRCWCTSWSRRCGVRSGTHPGRRADRADRVVRPRPRKTGRAVGAGRRSSASRRDNVMPPRAACSSPTCAAAASSAAGTRTPGRAAENRTKPVARAATATAASAANAVAATAELFAPRRRGHLVVGGQVLLAAGAPRACREGPRAFGDAGLAGEDGQHWSCRRASHIGG